MFVTTESVLVIVLVCLGKIRAQTGGVTNTGSGYSCVPAGFCNNNANGTAPPTGPGIDPRIVTPGSPFCPAGTIVCYTQGASSRCGVRLVPQTLLVDGPANLGAYPWQAYLQNSTNTYAGSGVLIDNYHILTAAHKVVNSRAAPATITAYLGVFAPSDITTQVNAPKSSPVASVCIHPQFVTNTLFNDLALLRLRNPIALSQTNINTACLPAASSAAAPTPYVGQRCVVAGWGQTAFVNNDAPTNPMRQVYVNVVSYATCRAAMSNAAVLGTNVDLYLDPTGEICAGGEQDRDACTQDGGAPLMCPNAADGRSYIAGLVIWGKGCGRTGVYGVYLNVPYYRNWIDTTVASLNNGGTC